MRLHLCVVVLLASGLAGGLACGGGSDAAAEGGGEGTALLCRDGADNDGDGHVDCADQDCALFLFCADPTFEPAPDGGRHDAGGGAAGRDGDGGAAGSDAGGDDGGGADARGGPEDARADAGAACGAGAAVTGSLLTSEAQLPLAVVEGSLRHKRDVDPEDGGCILTVDVTLLSGGCALRLVAGGRYTDDGLLAFESVEFTADSLCPGFLDEAEGTYRPVAAAALGGLRLAPTAVPDALAAATCAAVAFDVVLAGELFLAGADRPLVVSAVDLRVAATLTSIGDTEAACPCAPKCPEPDGGSDGCGGCCGGCVEVTLKPIPQWLSFGASVVGREARRDLLLAATGTGPVRVTQIAFDETSSPDFGLDLADGAPSAAHPLVIPPGGAARVSVTFVPDAENPVDPPAGQPLPDTGRIVVESDARFSPLEVAVSGYGVIPRCPIAVIEVEEGDQVVPQTLLHLRGDHSQPVDAAIDRWEWAVEQPAGSTSVFAPGPDAPNPTFEANVAGEYTFSLDVWDAQQRKSCDTAWFTVTVVPDEAIHIELLWHTPGDPDPTDGGPLAGADVDLHLVHPAAPGDPQAPDVDGDGAPDPWFDRRYDCFWANPRPDWDGGGPSLDRDDRDGAGPENVNFAVAALGRRYEVAVHYWNSHGYGDSYATVRVYIHRRLAFERSDVRLYDLDLWRVAWIDWPSGAVEPCETPDGALDVRHNYRPAVAVGEE